MTIQAGTILISQPLLEDPNFEQRVIFITAYNAKGAMGFVINHLFSRAINELEEFKQSMAFPLHDGGPVDREHLYFIHRCPDLIEGGEQVAGTVYLGGNFKKALTFINEKTIGQIDIRIFIGYCGWDWGQLEEEVEEGSWLAASINPEIVFEMNEEELWQKLYEENKRTA